jgi:hypothetical protein
MEKCKTCGQLFEGYRIDQGDGTCVFCHRDLDNRKDNYGNPRWDYVFNLQSMTEEKLFETTKKMVWLSAYAGNNPRSDYHWQCDRVYDEWIRREKSDMYDRAYKEVLKSELG